MSPILQSALLAAGLFLSLLIALAIGRRLGQRRIATEGEDAKAGSGAVEGAVFALLGLLIAFTFTSAASRYDHRRDMIVDQANTIGTAWLRIDLLPAADQPPLREKFRLYMDALLHLTEVAEDPAEVEAAIADLQTRQADLWRFAVDATSRDGRPQVASLLLPPINDMFDLSSSRIASSQLHVPASIVWLLIVLAVMAGLLAGHAMASQARPRLHMLVFAALISLTLYFIMDIEYPRLGFIKLNAADRFLVDLRDSFG